MRGSGLDVEIGDALYRRSRFHRGLEAGDRLSRGREGWRRDLLARGQEIHGEPGHERQDLDCGLVQPAVLARKLVGTDDAGEPVADDHRNEEGARGRLPAESTTERPGFAGRLGEHGALRLENHGHERVVLAAEVEGAHGLVAPSGRVVPEGLPAGKPVVPKDEKRDARRMRVHAREKSREDIDLRACGLDGGE